MTDLSWRKSSYSGGDGGNCIEIAAAPASSLSADAWRKSSYSSGEGGNCVEVATADAVLVRDTTDRAGCTVTVPASAWRAFTGIIRAS